MLVWLLESSEPSHDAPVCSAPPLRWLLLLVSQAPEFKAPSRGVQVLLETFSLSLYLPAAPRRLNVSKCGDETKKTKINK